MAERVSLQSDCSNCADLCCVAFAFSKGEDFAEDKQPDEPCQYLRTRHGCSIHKSRSEKGYPGCITFDCLGAGQRVTQNLFKGQSWRQSPELIGPMCEALRGMQDIHQDIELLRVAARFPLTPEERQQFEELISLLEPETEFTPETLSEFPLSAMRERVRVFLESLQHHVQARR